ncbi:Lipoprotein-anchoring transpeptidase ErfK/SrfK [Lutimaribacter pacificus]|uniref:Lipoprotein-anchoring transpeptidase ErfK/SrfK n=1 Tax=Lutimaribacter pacificus TaxID=391948 RepID=A0A1H0BR37_9RHOB|nr:L,D-transpeptidase [Lutimaribacter pacificus]SDN48078.1 Lipoprotein-anchoring transpeptidase ErfK/SrfK [Lutimaribacter pacificus]SHJ53157.1 Lipoprotein-anchoring transpeptidase ErfK/SrfK [Lutimaribacter pacificus]
MAGKIVTRRAMLLAGGAALLAPAVLRAEPAPDGRQGQPGVRHNVSSFSAQDWRDHFDTLGKGAIVADTVSRALHFWNADDTDYRVYPTSVPMSDELTKRGYTRIVRKKVGPDWTPTPSMIERGMDVRYMPPGPDNPLGTHAMYLSWPAYLIHGTHDTRKIGRRSSDGCIGLYNEMIADLFDRAPVGTQVRII